MSTGIKQKIAIATAALGGVAIGTLGVTSAFAAPAPAPTLQIHVVAPNTGSTAPGPVAPESATTSEAPGSANDPQEAGVVGSGHQDPAGDVQNGQSGATDPQLRSATSRQRNGWSATRASRSACRARASAFQLRSVARG